ncbi:MAG: hypothetical protein EWV76_01140 [Microcystis novacekii Mn_MB_F_20050700_S1]|uniref:Uncharacterized protein n=1 Tax=Microcystis novacekii Mn_MB_F_20050700_S1D TaxID=2486266 RepID=A0A552IF13_9CHRO|nr:MAG: hypothetical protein EWV54_22770 [Microcystis novacekii Mn_MB_F_20050700_S1D]TRU92942.1 MAG: hypothetical protein EWV76_01140 [Microcystis novacekii Mn_MB_F_20050700_S1]
MPNNNNQPDINKAIDVCMEEYKTLRTQILQTIQNRTNVIVFGGALVLTLLGIGISPIANLPIMKETTTVTRIPTDTTTNTITTKIEKKTLNITEQTISQSQSHPEGDSNHTNQETNSPSGLVIKEKATATEKISPQNFYDIPIERRIPSAIILGIIVPVSCGLIIYLVYANNSQIAATGRYIATNIEPKINDLYFNNLPGGQKPIVWETYMQTLQFGPEEGNWVTVVFGGIALVANVGGIFSAVNILNNMFFLAILLVPLIIIFLLCRGWKTKENMAELRDGEGSLRKIWYKEITAQNKEVKSTRIFWKSNYRVWEMYQNNDFKNLLNEIKNYSRTTEYNPPFYFNLDNGGGKRIKNIPELLELCIDNPNNFMQHIRQQDFENWLDNIEIRETELANIAQATREKNFPNDNERLHYFLRECCLVLIGRNL